jgi:hypothetical protein
LIVKDNVSTLGKVEHLREQIIVARTRTAMKNNEWVFSGRTIPCPVKRD